MADQFELLGSHELADLLQHAAEAVGNADQAASIQVPGDLYQWLTNIVNNTLVNKSAAEEQDRRIAAALQHARYLFACMLTTRNVIEERSSAQPYKERAAQLANELQATAMYIQAEGYHG